jgi:hypothetical protein
MGGMMGMQGGMQGMVSTRNLHTAHTQHTRSIQATGQHTLQASQYCHCNTTATRPSESDCSPKCTLLFPHFCKFLGWWWWWWLRNGRRELPGGHGWRCRHTTILLL